VTRIVDELMELKSSPETEDYRHFDPKQLRHVDGSQASKNRAPFHEAIVFVVGGGNYIEYQNLVDYARVRDNFSKLFHFLNLSHYRARVPKEIKE